MDFSVLMCVYAGDTIAQFKKAVESCTTEQTVMPTEVIIIQNGPVSHDIERYLASLENSSHNGSSPTFSIIRLPENIGLARALNKGIQETRTEWIARMDADDISLPDRFEKQVNYLTEHPQIDVLGTALQEFSESTTLSTNPPSDTTPDKAETISWGTKRILPTESDELSQYARFQSPVHHPTVMMRTSRVVHAGSYPTDAGRFEDYLLWERMLLDGSLFANLPEVLLGYRVDAGAYNRRGGFTMFTDELELQRTFARDGFTTRFQYLRNIVIRGLYRLIPTDIKKPLYRLRTAVKNAKLRS